MANKVRITYYRWEGSFLFFRIKNRCRECDMTYAVLSRLMKDLFQDRNVILEIRPWLDNWYKPILRGGWHAPIVMLNGKVFSQGIVPDIRNLVQRVAELLDDDLLMKESQTYSSKKKTDEIPENVQVYFSPACPHCVQLIKYLESNSVSYTGMNVAESASARDEIVKLTGKRIIPVTRIGETVIEGFNPDKLSEILDISPVSGRGIEGPAAVEMPEIFSDELAEWIEKAKQILKENSVKGRTKASRKLYPHQWNWDAGFIARGYLHYDPPRAYDEMLKLFEGQWSDGFLPHIVFNEDFLDYFPGTDFWKTSRSGRVPEGIHTSGISQPPVHASMMVRALDLDPEKDRALEFLKEFYPKCRDLHDYYFRERDPFKEHLVSLVHPWESGLDNAPIWDEPLSKVSATSPWSEKMQKIHDELSEKGSKPKRPYVAKYSYLIESLYLQDYKWDSIMKGHPFLVQDILFNTVLCKAEADLAVIAEAIGSDSAIHVERAKLMGEAINRKLWDSTDGLYYGFDLKNGVRLKRDTVFSYIPLYAGIVPDDRGEALIGNLKTHCFCIGDGNCTGIPSYDMCQADYNGEFYWRGPIWFNMDWYVKLGFDGYGLKEESKWLEHSLLKIVMENGFYEYFEPETGKGLGADGFSWTAALFIDLAMDFLKNENRGNLKTGADS